ncbi:hypothetical protein D3C87_1552660 [compost metagenome]
MRALAGLMAKLLQAIAHQPWAIAQVDLEVVFQVFEVAISEGATEAPHTGFTDVQFRGDISGGLERQFIEVGQHIVSNHPARGGGG